MTQTTVRLGKHANNVRNYINNKKALLRDFQNISDPRHWFNQMNTTREVWGTNTPIRITRDKEGKAKEPFVIQHRILAFIPDECDIYGGKMTPELCMRAAKEYVQEHYPDHEVALALHKEHCNADDTYRYAVHMVINMTNLATGQRWDAEFHEGAGVKLKFFLASQGKEIEEKWGLAEVIKGEQNSQVHKRQYERLDPEKKIAGRRGKPYKDNIRRNLIDAMDKSTTLDGFMRQLLAWGIGSEVKAGRLYVRDLDNPKYVFRADRLRSEFEMRNLLAEFATPMPLRETGILARAQRERQAAARDQADKIADAAERYTSRLKRTYATYAKEAQTARGVAYVDFPTIKLPAVPPILRDDKTSINLLLNYRQQAENLRLKFAGVRPAKKGKAIAPEGNSTGFDSSGGISQQRQRRRGPQQPQK